MNDSDFDDMLRSLRGGQPLPANFRQGVWRRIENAQAPGAVPWYAAVLDMIVRPWGAAAGMVATITLGVWLGGITVPDRPDDQMVYIQSINPFSHTHP